MYINKNQIVSVKVRDKHTIDGYVWRPAKYKTILGFRIKTRSEGWCDSDQSWIRYHKNGICGDICFHPEDYGCYIKDTIHGTKILIRRPRVIIDFSNDEYKVKYFDTIEEAEDYAEELMKNLDEFVEI